MMRIFLGCIAAGCIASAASAQPILPKRVSPSEAAGAIFTSPGATKMGSADGAVNVPVLSSSDKKMSAGIYKAGASTFRADPYPVDEFMYFLEGSVKLTSEDGSVMNVTAGDAIAIPKGWKGTWETTGYKKYYVVYNPEGREPGGQ